MAIFKFLFGDEFVIDEPKEEVFRAKTTEDAGEGSNGEIDLLTSISRVMIENENLISLTHRLEHSKASDEEMFKLMKQLVPMLDGFDRVLSFARSHPLKDEIQNWLKSVESVYFKIMSTLENFGLTPMEVIGKRINLDYHEVVDYRKTNEYPEDTIIGEKQKGYIFRGRVLRDAKVIIAQN